MDYFKIRVFYPWVICLCVFIWIHAWSHGQDRHDGKIYIYLSFMMVSQWYGNCFHYMYLPPNTSSILMNNIEYLLVTFLLYGMYVFCKATDIDENIANQNHATRTRTPKPGYLNLSNIFLLAHGVEIIWNTHSRTFSIYTVYIYNIYILTAYTGMLVIWQTTKLYSFLHVVTSFAFTLEIQYPA